MLIEAIGALSMMTQGFKRLFIFAQPSTLVIPLPTTSSLTMPL